MQIFEGEELVQDMKKELNKGVRYAIIAAVHDDLIQNPQSEVDERLRYMTVDLTFIDFPGVQTRVAITGFEASSGEVTVPQVNSICMCIFLPNRKALLLTQVSGGDVGATRTMRDLVKSGVVLPIQRGEQLKWNGSTYWYLRSCAKKIVHTIGTVLDATLAKVLLDGKEIHYQVEHESGTKISIDASGNIILSPGSGAKMFEGLVPSGATDENALVTRKFLLDFYNDLVQKFNLHTHPYVNVTTPSTTSVTATLATEVSPSLPDTVSTPDIRAKSA